jgi:hypothetical protein
MKEKNTSVTFRFPTKEYNTLKKIAKNEKISLNTLVNHITSRFLEWDMIVQKSGWIIFHKNIMKEILQCVDDDKLTEIAEHAAEYLKDLTLLMSGTTDLESCLEMLRNKTMNSGFVIIESEHENNRRMVFQHDMGRKWSSFYKTNYERMLVDLGHPVKCEITNNTLVLDIFPDGV